MRQRCFRGELFLIFGNDQIKGNGSAITGCISRSVSFLFFESGLLFHLISYNSGVAGFRGADCWNSSLPLKMHPKLKAYARIIHIRAYTKRYVSEILLSSSLQFTDDARRLMLYHQTFFFFGTKFLQLGKIIT